MASLSPPKDPQKESSLVICGNCRAEIKAGYRFCRTCGLAVSSPVREEVEAKPIRPARDRQIPAGVLLRTILTILASVIVLVVAIAAGVLAYREWSVDADRREVTDDLIALAERSQQYFRTPLIRGGGGGRFDGVTLEKLRQLPDRPDWTTTGDGHYMIHQLSETSLMIEGVGTEIGRDERSPVRVVMQVWPDSAKVVPAGTN